MSCAAFIVIQHVYILKKEKTTIITTKKTNYYALASISTAQFHHCGQRFDTVTLDGTMCTW